MSDTIIILMILLILNSFFSISEYSIASSRKLKLENLIKEGNNKAKKVLELSNNPNHFITVIQISLNIIALVAGIVGDESLAPVYKNFLIMLGIKEDFKFLEIISKGLSVISITYIFILFSELIPKRIAFSNPEKVACYVINILLMILKLFKPFVWSLSITSNFILNLFNISTIRDDKMTFAEVTAVLSEGAKTGLLEAKEHKLVENVFSLTDRSVVSSMTSKENIVFLDINFTKEKINEIILFHPHSRFLVCDGNIDNFLGYIDSSKLLHNVLKSSGTEFNRENLAEQGLKQVVIIPSSLSLLEVLDKFREYREDIAVIIDEFGKVVGLITLNDIMATIVGNVILVNNTPSLIVERGTNSWLIDGKVSIQEIKELFKWETLPGEDSYETISGFLMFIMKCVPKKAQKIEYKNVIFEIVDVEGYRIDEVMATLK